MLKRSLPFTLLMFLPCLMMSYPISIKGLVYNNHQEGVAGTSVQVTSLPDDAFQLDTMLMTDQDGAFLLLIEIPDNVLRGTLLFHLDSCSPNQVRRIVYHPNHLEHKLTLRACKNSDRECAVKIRAEKLDDLSFLLTAEVKGVEPYSYKWSTGETDSAITVTEQGVYHVVVETGDGCQTRDQFNLRPGSDCRTEIQVKRDSGLVVAYQLTARTKGLEPFTYRWSTGDTTEQILVTEPGEYCVLVTDADGCQSRACIQIRDQTCETKIQIVHTTLTANVPGIQLFARSKGRAPFQYVWNNGDTTQMIRVQEPGQYCVVVTDAAGCISRDCVVIDPSTDCKTTISVNSLNTSSGPGLHLMARSHGRPPFSYQWSTGDTTKSIRVDELKEYCVEVSDANGCLSRDCVDLSKLTEACAVEIHRTQGGNIIARPRGFSPFTFLWSTGDTTRSIHPLDGGEYCVTITNAFGCSARACITINDSNPSCRVKIQRKPLNNQGAVELTARVAGNREFNFLWSTGDTTQSIIVKEDGEYCVEVYNLSCKARDCVKVQLGEAASVKSIANAPGQNNNPRHQKVDLQAFPNPVIGLVRLQWQSSESGEVRIVVSQLGGPPVLLRRMEGGLGTNELELDLSPFAPGFYVIQILGKEFTEQLKVVKVH